MYSYAAQATEDSAVKGIETIQVTASRRASTVQEAPINITALDGDVMKDQNISQLSDVARWVPGLSIADQGSREGSPIIVRGLNTNSSGPGSNAGTVATYIGEIPLMTERGTFVINGAERVVVSQLHRSPGVAFGQTRHPNGTPIYSARIIPFRGSWVEFATDINHIMYVYIDRRKKFPATTLLRALNYTTDEEILNLFNLVEEIDVKKLDPQLHHGRISAEDVIDIDTGEIFVTKDDEINEEIIENIKASDVKKIKVITGDTNSEQDLILNTLRKDTSISKEEALFAIYRQLRTGEAPDVETAEALIEKLFFNEKRYDLGDVGRFRMNDKLNLDIPTDTRVLTIEDIVAIMKSIIQLKNGNVSVDDIDHLGNRRVRTVGEQLQQQFNIGLARMSRTIRERMNIRDNENMQPQDLVNARTISAVINAFFGTNQLSQFMDQTNPLSELTHKRRISALGPGGLTRERAGFEVRDVHHSHYGRLCPIETPEGPNIGLISSLTLYARVNNFGFLETPYRKVKDGKVSKSVDYLSADQEDEFVIAQANAPIDEQGKFVRDRVRCRKRGEFPVVTPENVHYMDVAPSQLVSAGASLIPFLEHDDANRALMGSNIQRQAVPLLVPESPLVGTGMEYKIAHDSQSVILAEDKGVVEYVDAQKIIVKYESDPDSYLALTTFDDERRVEYTLVKFNGTNQETCFNQRAAVAVGQKVKKGDVLADGPAIDKGELALGKNVLVGFMPWRGYNFEDAIIISERIVADDEFTSLHIEEFELQVRETKRGDEELTRDIPNVSEEATKDLDERGIIREGAEVKEGDILIGKITPKGETDPTPEEKLLKAIFGDKAGDVKDASLKAHPGLKGTVIKTRLFSRKRRDQDAKKQEKKDIEALEHKLSVLKNDHYKMLVTKLTRIANGKKTIGISDLDGTVLFRKNTAISDTTFEEIEDVTKLDYTQEWFADEETNEMIKTLFSNYFKIRADFEEDFKRLKLNIQSGDELSPGVVQLAKVYVAKKRKLQVGDKMAGRHGNKGIVSNIVPEVDMPYMEDGRSVDVCLNPLGVPSRMNIGQILEMHLGMAGRELGLQIQEEFDKKQADFIKNLREKMISIADVAGLMNAVKTIGDMSDDEFLIHARDWAKGIKFAAPIFEATDAEEFAKLYELAKMDADGKVVLYDGKTGQQIKERVNVGYMYMLKLHHLVDEKIHARSTGPYSLVTQQPVGGKALFGGQRFGEMEVWALEAYGASAVLKEMLTIKSDDVDGRVRAYKALTRGELVPASGIPETLFVLTKELQALALDVDILDEVEDDE